MGLGELGAIGICVDEYCDGEMKGRIYSYLKEEPETFNSVISLVKHINNLFDEGDYPQATMKCRGFGKTVVASSAQKTERAIPTISRSAFARTNIRGRKATFRVKVMFRQNASWQGVLCWVEKNREENFRSVLELMMLLDSSFEVDKAANIADDERLAGNM